MMSVSPQRLKEIAAIANKKIDPLDIPKLDGLFLEKCQNGNPKNQANQISLSR